VKNPKSVTILVRGSTEHVIAEVKRALEDAIGDLRVAIQDGKVVAGGGACEIALSRGLYKYSNTLSGKEQLCIQQFAKAMECVPRTLAESAGLDPIDKVAEMKAAQAKGSKWTGIDVFSGKAVDMWRNNVIEPLKIKTQAIKSATEASVMILRIDDVIAGSKSSAPDMPPGMGGMGGMM